MDQIKFDVLVSVFERTPSEVAGRLSIDRIPLSQALHTILRWPQERRRRADRHAGSHHPWASINDLYRRLYSQVERPGSMARSRASTWCQSGECHRAGLETGPVWGCSV